MKIEIKGKIYDWDREPMTIWLNEKDLKIISNEIKGTKALVIICKPIKKL